MRVVSERQLAIALGALPGTPRVVAGGNFGPLLCSTACSNGTACSRSTRRREFRTARA